MVNEYKGVVQIMDELSRIHSKSMLLMIVFPCFAFTIMLFCVYCFDFWLPFRLFAAIALLGPLVSAITRIKLWKNRFERLSPDVLDSRPAKIFFAAIPIEILFWVIAMGCVLSAN